MKLAAGQHIVVAGAAGIVRADVLKVGTPDNLPDIEGVPPPKLVAAILRELEIDQIAAIGYRRDGQEVMFLAIHNEKRGWYDLQRQHLYITAVQSAGRPV